MTELARRAVYYSFRIACILFAGYMILLQILKYKENLDTPKISFKEFMESPEHRYPDLTFCFSGHPTPQRMYKENRFGKDGIYGPIQTREYHSLILGHSKAWNTYKTLNRSSINENISGIDYDRATAGNNGKVKHYFQDYSTTFVNGTQKYYPFFMQMSYQIPGKVCFTRTFQKLQNESFLLSHEKVNINLEDVSLSMFAHYPGQVLRTIFGRDRVLKSIFKIESDDLKNSNVTKAITIDLSQMQVVKGRPDGNVPCNPKPYMDDNKFWLSIYRRLYCLPPYWRKCNGDCHNKTSNVERFIKGWQLGSNNLKKLHDCATESEFKKMTDLIHSEGQTNHMRIKNEIVSSFLPPCNEMAVNVNVKENEIEKVEKAKPNKKMDDEKRITMKIIYMMQKYQEIKNEKELSFEMLWSSIGGFVGMFIGYSMLQFLDNGLDWILSLNGPKKAEDKEDCIPLSEKLKRELWIRKKMKYREELSATSRFSVTSSPRPNYEYNMDKI